MWVFGKKQGKTWYRAIGNFGSLRHYNARDGNGKYYTYNNFVWLIKGSYGNPLTLFSKRKLVS